MLFLWTVRLTLFTFYMDAKMTDLYKFFLMFAYDYEVHCLKQKLAWSDGLETKKGISQVSADSVYFASLTFSANKSVEEVLCTRLFSHYVTV